MGDHVLEPSPSCGVCSVGGRGSSPKLYAGIHSIPLDLPDAVGHVLAHHLPLGHLYNLAAGRPAGAQRKTSCKGEARHGVTDTIHS